MGTISFAAQLLAAVSSMQQARQMAPSKITFEEQQQIKKHFEKADSPLEYEILLDSECNAKYLLVTTLDEYAILDRESLCMVETGNGKPYSSETACKIYSNSAFGPHYFETDGTQIWEPSNSALKVSVSNVGTCENGFNYDAITSASEIPSNAHKCDNYEYFINLKDHHGFNRSSICTLIANEILLGYYDTFYDDSFVPEKWDKVSLAYGSEVSWKSWNYSPGTGKETTNGGEVEDNRMRDYMLDYCVKNVSSSIEEDGLNCLNQVKILKNHVETQGVGYELTCVEGNLYDSINNRNQSLIKSTIDSGRPIIANGGKHSTVAFAYDDNYVYVHSGWGSYGKTPWTTYISWSLSCTPSSIDLKPTGNHVHSNNYYNVSKKRYYCPCGYYSNAYSVSLDKLPNDNLTLKDGTDAILRCSSVNKQNDDSLLFSPNSASDAYLEIDVGSKYIKSISFCFRFDTTNYLPEAYIEWKKKDGSWSNYYAPIELATKTSEVRLRTFTAINAPKHANAIRISFNYVEYQRQQMAVSNISVEIG